MATSCNMSDELFTESMLIGFPCSPCKKDDRIVEASKYCEECGEYFCDKCLNYHQKFTATSGHKVSVISKTLVPKGRITEVKIPTNSASSSQEITGICFIRRGDKLALVFTEWYTKLVKVLDMNSNKVVGNVSIQSKPYGVKHLPGSDLLAVTCRKPLQIVFIELDDTLNLRIVKTEQTSKSCRGLDVISGPFNDNMFVVSGGHRDDSHKGFLDIYAVGRIPDGMLLLPLETFSLSFNYEPSPLPKNVAIDLLRQKLYVSDGRNGVVILNFNGKLVGTLSDPSLDMTRAICCDDDGNVYVGGVQSANVVKFDSQGKLVGEIANKRNGLKSPICMCFDKETKTLVIGSQNDHVMRILKL